MTASKLAGATNWVAACVSTGVTWTPHSVRREAISHALYAAMDPVTPRTTCLFEIALLILLPVLSLLLSRSLFPAPRTAEEKPIFGERVAAFHAEREVRNLRLLLEMYRALHDRYPESLGDLVKAKLLGPRRLVMLRNLEISYRSLRGGTRYFLQSGRYGPMVRSLPVRAPAPLRPVPEPILSGSLDPNRSSSE